MIASLRQEFLNRWTPAAYERFLSLLTERSGMAVPFRICETPCFFSSALLERMAQAGRELILQLVGDPAYQELSEHSIPDAYRCPREDPRPLFTQVDFGLQRDESGEWQPKLVEIQGFPSLYAFQPVLAQTYRDAYGLDPTLQELIGPLDALQYQQLLTKAIVGQHDPENVVLLEIDPTHQKTLPDFLLTERACGIATVDIRDVKRQGARLFYEREGRLVPIRRIYNRVIVDELERKQIATPFSFRDDLDVEWAGHPNWFFRLSKFSIPYLHHPTVPRTRFFHEVGEMPHDPENYVLKPLYSFAGLGVIVGPTAEQLAAVPLAQRRQYLLQERVRFTPIIDTPSGPTQAEVRIMYIWLDELVAATTIVRMGRGKMMGVDHNRSLDWVGASASLSPRV